MLIEFGAEISHADSVDITSFDGLFPLGLPVSSNIKPNFKIDSVKGRQRPGFVENEGVGILRGDVYPRFDIVDFMNWCDPEKRLGAYVSPEFSIDNIRPVALTIGYNLCSTPSEKQFFKDYLSSFVIPFKSQTSENAYSFTHLIDVVPALIPQVWVRFESYNSDQRNRMGYKDEHMPYRVDFTAFWNSRRYIIMIDGIEHYAKQGRGGWDADEEKYAARLREDRLLRTEGWHVFRLGNWEVKDEGRRKKALQELREFIGFEMPNPPISIIRPRTKVVAPVRTPPSPPRPAPIVTPPRRRRYLQEIFKTGDKVTHQLFGQGIVVSTREVENDTEITVAFTGKGTKRLLQSFANLSHVSPEGIADDEDIPF
jgi:very-short-patch-repair endonuclease